MDIKIGTKIRATKDIWDDGEDHHPPGYCAYKGDTLIVREVFNTYLAVSHEDILNSSFRIFNEEFELLRD